MMTTTFRHTDRRSETTRRRLGLAIQTLVKRLYESRAFNRHFENREEQMSLLKEEMLRLSVLLPTLFFVGCGSLDISGKSEEPLRVGITPDYAPLIYKQEGKVTGLEADLARQLGQALGRPIEFIQLRWEDQLSELMKGHTDIVMSGMSITEARKLRATFTEPYLLNGAMALFRSHDAANFKNKNDILNTTETVGVQSGTTAEVFVRKHLPNARVIALASPEVAPRELRRRRIDLFIHDAHSIALLASENEGELTGLFVPLTDEAIAWAVRRSDTKLLADVNHILQRWKNNGVLIATIEKWMPYADRVTY